jgi:hypothetical protein
LPVTRRLLVVVASAALVAGCGGDDADTPSRSALPAGAPPVGPGPRYRPPSLGSQARRAEPIAGMRCTQAGAAAPRFGAHLELFANRYVVTVPQGIGIAPPRSEDGAYVRGGRCEYPLRTREPTGVIELAAGTRATLGDLFAVWGQPLSRTRIAGFEGAVRAFVDGRPWRGDPRAIPLERHAQITLEVNGYVRPHADYRFPPGL